MKVQVTRAQYETLEIEMPDYTDAQTIAVAVFEVCRLPEHEGKWKYATSVKRELDYETRKDPDSFHSDDVEGQLFYDVEELVVR